MKTVKVALGAYVAQSGAEETARRLQDTRKRIAEVATFAARLLGAAQMVNGYVALTQEQCAALEREAIHAVWSNARGMAREAGIEDSSI